MVVRRGRDQVGVDPGVGQCFDKASRDQAVDFFVGVMGSVVNGETIEEAQGGRVQQYAILDDCVGCKVEDVGEWFGHDGSVCLFLFIFCGTGSAVSGQCSTLVVRSHVNFW